MIGRPTIVVGNALSFAPPFQGVRQDGKCAAMGTHGRVIAQALEDCVNLRRFVADEIAVVALLSRL